MKHAASEAGPLRDPRDRLIIALDTPSLDAAREIAGGLHGAVRWFKVGPELFTAAGPAAVEALRGSGRVFLIVCPGIRPAGTGQDDQRRVLAPREAIAAGADMLVVGRPVTRAPDPRRAAEEVLREIALAE